MKYILTIVIAMNLLWAEKGKEMSSMKEAVFGGGCFWCLQPPFDKLEGVLETKVGYTGGTVENPSYELVTTGTTGHVEVIWMRYDESKVSYETLLKTFWRNIDPTQEDGQFNDRGPQYRTVIFYADEAQRESARLSKKQLSEKGPFAGKNIATTIESLQEVYFAEDYHQKYYEKSPIRYKMYKYGSGRGGFIEDTWGPESE